MWAIIKVLIRGLITITVIMIIGLGIIKKKTMNRHQTSKYNNNYNDSDSYSDDDYEPKKINKPKDIPGFVRVDQQSTYGTNVSTYYEQGTMDNFTVDNNTGKVKSLYFNGKTMRPNN